MQSMKLHYKKKVSLMKEELVQRDSEKQIIINELEIYKHREQDLRKVCENQVKEICEEYAKNIKIAGNVHNDELVKIKNSYEKNAEMQNNKFLEEINYLRARIREIEEENSRIVEENNFCRTQGKEYEKIVKNYKEKFESVILNKESLDKELQEKNSFNKELQYNIKKVKAEYESQLKYLKDENSAKTSQISKMNQEMDELNFVQNKLKQEFESQIEVEKVKTMNLESKFLRIEAAYSELNHKYELSYHKSQVLESELHKQTSEFSKKYEIEANKHYEKVKNLENELKSLYLANTNQAKEMDALQRLCAEIEGKQEEDSRKLVQKHEENIREIKKYDKFEFLKVSDALEANKKNLALAEQKNNELEKRLFESSSKEDELIRNIQNLEAEKKEFFELINDQRHQINNLSLKIQQKYSVIRKNKEIVKNKAARLSEN